LLRAVTRATETGNPKQAASGCADFRELEVSRSERLGWVDGAIVVFAFLREIVYNTKFKMSEKKRNDSNCELLKSAAISDKKESL
jgi:hypothetical protein